MKPDMRREAVGELRRGIGHLSTHMQAFGVSVRVTTAEMQCFRAEWEKLPKAQ